MGSCDCHVTILTITVDHVIYSDNVIVGSCDCHVTILTITVDHVIYSDDVIVDHVTILRYWDYCAYRVNVVAAGRFQQRGVWSPTTPLRRAISYHW